MTVNSFNFNSDPPTLTVEAGYSKRRRTDVMPLRADLAKRVQEWIASKKKQDPAKPLARIAAKRTADMLQKDLKRAREAWLKESADETDLQKREQTSFLQYRDEQGN